MGRIKDSKVCAFCTNLSAEGNHSIVEKFYTSFLTTDLIDNCESSKRRKSKNSKKSGLIVNVPDKWTICKKCLPECQLALQKKENVDKVECQVRNLQLNLLMELNKLFGEMEGMNEHLKNIQQSLLTNKPEKSADRSSLRRKRKENDKFIATFHQKLIKVFQDIKQFEKEISRKLLKTPTQNLQFSQTGDNGSQTADNFLEEILNPVIVKTESVDLSIDHNDNYDDNFNNLENPPENFDDDSHSHSHADYYYDDDNDNCEMTTDDNPPIKNEAHQAGQQSKRLQETLPSVSSSESEDEDNPNSDHRSSSSDSDLDFDPNNKSHPSTSSSSKTQMSKFRRSLISRIRKSRTIATSNRLPKSPTDPRRPFFIKYKNSKFFLENHEILLIDSPAEILQCGSCPFQVKIHPKKSTSHPEDQIFEHILSKHLLLYTCATCCKSFETLYSLKYHRNVHLEPDKKRMVNCPICEKPISATSRKNLKEHQWTHLSAEEKRDPQYQKWMPTKIRQYFVEGRKNVCGTCGKDFLNRSRLRDHEKTHLSLEERREDKVVCTKCGREIFKTGFRAHERMCGRERESKKSVYCPVKGCGVRMKNKKWLDIHAGEEHKGERIFGCEICGKMYGSLAYLRGHMECHDRVKKWVCEGCGQGYQQKRNLKRHKMSGGGCRGIGWGGGGVNFKREIN